MSRWGPLSKRLDDGNEMGMRKRFQITTGDTVHWAECTDGWTGKKYTDYNDAEHEFGEHLGKHHGGK